MRDGGGVDMVKNSRSTVAAAPATRFRLPDGSRSVESPWVWRGFLFLAFIALGLCLTFVMGGQSMFAVAWAVITAGWFATSMWLWRKHVRADDAAWQARRPAAR